MKQKQRRTILRSSLEDDGSNRDDRRGRNPWRMGRLQDHREASVLLWEGQGLAGVEVAPGELGSIDGHSYGAHKRGLIVIETRASFLCAACEYHVSSVEREDVDMAIGGFN